MQHHGEMPWSINPNGTIQISHFPEHFVERLPSWGWVIKNQFIFIISINEGRDAAGDAGTLSSVKRTLHGVTLALPILEAQARGERRWCAFCGALSLRADLTLCKRCRQVGYCDRRCRDQGMREGAHITVCARLAAKAAWVAGRDRARRVLPLMSETDKGQVKA